MLGIHLMFKKVGNLKNKQCGNRETSKVKFLLFSHKFYFFISVIVLVDFVQIKFYSPGDYRQRHSLIDNFQVNYFTVFKNLTNMNASAAD